jgi:hypothetical protein
VPDTVITDSFSPRVDGTTGMTSSVRPPLPVILVIILSYVVAALDIAAGVIIILLRYADEVIEAGAETFFTYVGIVMILSGLLIIAVASGLSRGRKGARILTTIALSVSLALGIVSIIDSPDWWKVAELALGAIVIAALWLGPSGRFFRQAAQQHSVAN